MCAGAAFFLFITLAYKMTYDYTMDKYMEKVEKETRCTKGRLASEKTKCYCDRRRGSKKADKKGFILRNSRFVVVYLEDKNDL